MAEKNTRQVPFSFLQYFSEPYFLHYFLPKKRAFLGSDFGAGSDAVGEGRTGLG
jgi:hypothetical protein